MQLFHPPQPTVPQLTIITEIVDAVRELSQTRTGALLVIETNAPIDEQNFPSPGVKLDALVSFELIQTIFQPKSYLRDGAILIRGERIIIAGAILPCTHKTASWRLDPRHRAALGIAEQTENCLCIVVSGETGSIAVAERGILNRPLTSNKLCELLIARLPKL
ncbi:MAG: Cyclic di-AMP synthase CdaS [Chroococcidiopsis sp. SAG 2025]|nr:Cyclic di-AMP synthase CdaS [Chroococcidiopsis sp. SAG 2025]